MNILQLSTKQIGGGAEKVARDLFWKYQERGHKSWLAVGYHQLEEPNVFEILRYERDMPWARACWAAHGRLEPFEARAFGVRQIRIWLRAMANGLSGIQRELGWEQMNHPGSRNILSLLPKEPDIVHAHNLHGNYFDLRELPILSRTAPIVITLHDEWMLTGHCAYSVGCARWEIGCGHCPDLSIYPAIQRDATAFNHRRKSRIYSQSDLYIAAPSKWLLDRARRSLLSRFETRLIPYGVDLATYHPMNRAKVRAELDLPSDGHVLLFAAIRDRRNPFKDYETVKRALHQLDTGSLGNPPITFVGLGGGNGGELIGNIGVQHVPFQRDPRTVAKYFQAATAVIHSAHADNFPNIVLEAMACGTPVIGTAVGGITEQIDDGVTGFLVPPGDSGVMAGRMLDVLGNHDLRERMGSAAAKVARRRFSLNRQADDYLGWYEEIIRSRRD